MNEELKQFILNGDFERAKELIEKISFKELDSTISLLSHDVGSINGYAFICYLLKSKETASFHYLASELMAVALCHIPYAYHLALFHARRAAVLAPKDISYKEYLLFFNIVPDKPLSDKEASQIAKEILSVDPKNERALEAIERLKGRSKI